MQRKRRIPSVILSVILAVVMALGLVPNMPLTIALADAPVQQNGVYMLGAADDLAWFAQQVNMGGEARTGAAELTADIDLAGAAWTPIGTSANAFVGVFDGAGHTVSGLNVTGTGDNAGLFGYVGANGEVRNLTVEGAINRPAATSVGGVVGQLYGAGGVIENCINKVTVTGGTNVGGIVGYVNGSGAKRILNCVNLGSVTSITASSADAGGLVGRLYYPCDVVNSYNRGTVTATGATNPRVGGLAGYMGDSGAKFTNCYTTGAVSGVSTSSYVHAGVGYLSSGSMSNCHALTSEAVYGNVASKDDTYMKSAGFAADLGGGFIADLTPHINDGYPIVKWQNPAATYTVTLTVSPADAVVELKQSGSTVTPASASNGVYTFSGLNPGAYQYTIFEAAGDYVTQSGNITVSYSDIDKTVTLARQLYDVTFSVTPADAVISITQAGFEQSQAAVGGAALFSFPMGTYSYKAEKFGYITQSGSVRVAKSAGAAPVTINLSESATRGLTFNVTPSDASITVTHDVNGVQTPVFGATYSLYEGNTYSYIARRSGYLAAKGTVTIGSADDTLYITLIPGATPWDGTVAAAFSGGGGSASDPYLIGDAEELAYMRSLLSASATNAAYGAACYKLTADIDLSGEIVWPPIGPSSSNNFRGVFDGSGKTVSGLYITTGTYQGLFGYIGAGGIVKDLTVSGASVTGTTYIGAVAGSNAGEISGVTVDNSVVTGTQRVGGVAGINAGAGKVTACANLGGAVRQSANGDYGIGGVAGENAGGVSLSYNTANIVRVNGGTSNDGHFGGIVGNNTTSGTVDACYNTGIVPAGYRSGGIVGLSASASLISNCYNTGAVSKSPSSSSCGGVLGTSTASSTDVMNCYYLDTCVGDGASAFGAAKTAEELRALSPVLGGAFDNDLTPAINNGYPILKWQNPDAAYSVTLTVTPADASVTFKPSGGADRVPDSSGNSVYIFNDLTPGAYEYAVTEDAGDYAAESGVITLSFADVNKAVTLARNQYAVTFNVTPVAAAVSITQEGFEQTKTVSGGAVSFSLPIGTYTYSAEKFGYITQTGTVTVVKATGASPVTVNLTEALRRNVTFDVTPSNAAVIVTHATEGAQTPTSDTTYSLYESQTYSYTVRLTGYATVKDSVTVNGSDSTVTVVLEEGLTAWDGVTKTEPALLGGAYQIYTAEELAWFRDKVNSQVITGNSSFTSANSTINAILLSDIDLGGYEWIPIAQYMEYQNSSRAGFAGTFDGNGKTVYGLKISTLPDRVNQNNGPWPGGGAGLFGSVYYPGVVKDVTVHGDINGVQYSGGVVGYCYGGTISGCDSYVNITLTQTGRNISVGGIVGTMSNSSDMPVVENCVNYGNINGGANSYIGGVVGNGSYGTVSYCGNEGNITAQDYVGGIVGSGGVTVLGCYNAGNIAGSLPAKGVGGIAGYQNLKGITDCYNLGTVTGGAGSAGGIAGDHREYYAGAVIKNCYNAGTVVSSGVSGAIAGTIEARVDPAVADNCYYLEGTAANAIGANGAATDTVTSLTDAELRLQTTADALGSLFVLKAGGYPKLFWQSAGAVIPKAITIKDIPGITPPVRGEAPVTTITTDEYTGTVTWSPADGVFAPETVYTATITLTAEDGYSLSTVAANFFRVAGATNVTNAAVSGVVTAIFPKTKSEAALSAAFMLIGATSGGAQTWIEAAQYTVPVGTNGEELFKQALDEKGIGYTFRDGWISTITKTPGVPVGNGTYGDSTSGWMFTVNGELAVVPLRDIDLRDGDSIAVFYVMSYYQAASIVVGISTVPGVTPPVWGETAVTAVETSQYTGTVAWSPALDADGAFEDGAAYTATITLTPKTQLFDSNMGMFINYTLTGVPSNFFRVPGAVSVANARDSGVITAVFPATAVVKDALAAAIMLAEGLDEYDYTPETWEALRDALETAVNVFNDPSATKARVESATAALQAALDAMERNHATFRCAVKSMLAKTAKLQQIPYEWDGTIPLVFSTSNAAVCNVTQDGVLVPMKAGIAVITITLPDRTKYIFAVTVSA